jgi:hypothetical protein
MRRGIQAQRLGRGIISAATLTLAMPTAALVLIPGQLIVRWRLRQQHNDWLIAERAGEPQ